MAPFLTMAVGCAGTHTEVFGVVGHRAGNFLQMAQGKNVLFTVIATCP